MAQLVARPAGALSFRFEITQDGGRRGWVRHRLFKPHGAAEIDGVAMIIQRVALLTWTIGDGSTQLARVERSGPLGL